MNFLIDLIARYSSRKFAIAATVVYVGYEIATQVVLTWELVALYLGGVVIGSVFILMEGKADTEERNVEAAITGALALIEEKKKAEIELASHEAALEAREDLNGAVFGETEKVDKPKKKLGKVKNVKG